MTDSAFPPLDETDDGELVSTWRPKFNEILNSYNRMYYPIRGNGRAYCYSDDRWITNSDDNYGTAYYQFTESGGTGVDPIVEWEHLGDIAPAGLTVDKFIMAGHTNSVDVTEIEILLVKKKPDPATRWQTGIDNDAEDAHVELYRGLWWANTDPDQVTFTGNSNDLHLREFQIDPVVGLIDETSFLSIYMKPTNVSASTTRYFRCNYLWLLK